LARYVAYYRVRSGPGSDREAALSAQGQAVRGLLKAGDTLIGEFIEDEVPHQRRRPHFEAAVRSAKRLDAILVIPRFRPIHRSAAFVDRLRDEGIEFLALDMPEANRATITSLAAVSAQHRRAVSERIRASLLIAKSRGKRLGNPEIAVAQLKAVQSASDRAQETRQALRGEVVKLHNEGRSLRAIAAELNRRGIPTARSREWHASSVRKILAEANGGPS
jgi:DNA invertase Pin-like site-specific DNA recombinase